MINFASCFTIGKALGWGTFSKCKAGLGYHLVLVPLFWEWPHLRALPYTKDPKFPFEDLLRDTELEGRAEHEAGLDEEPALSTPFEEPIVAMAMDETLEEETQATFLLFVILWFNVL